MQMAVLSAGETTISKNVHLENVHLSGSLFICCNGPRLAHSISPRKRRASCMSFGLHAHHIFQ